jgi:hypothetical protein
LWNFPHLRGGLLHRGGADGRVVSLAVDREEADMTETFTDGEGGDPVADSRWMALQELGTIARAVLLATVAMAIGWLVSSLVEGRVPEEPPRAIVGTP